MPGSPKEWKAVALRVPTRCEDDLVGMLSHLVLGIHVEPGDGGMSGVELYVESDREVAMVRQALAGAFSRLGIKGEGSGTVVRSVPDGRWVENYQESLRPFTAGDRFVIHPGDEPPDPSGSRIPIVLVPGRAFGTGEHETTRLCLSALERQVAPGSHWLDAGCGSGILSVAAAMLGAAQVTAVDIDPDSVDVCREVAAVNGVTDSVQVLEGSLDQVADSGFDGAVANIHAPFFLQQAAGLHRLLRTEGVLVCTGFLESDLPAIVSALETGGFAIRSSGRDGEWALIEAESLP